VATRVTTIAASLKLTERTSRVTGSGESRVCRELMAISESEVFPDHATALEAA
jgi:hypothetical protein